jgi:hypothetical protein
MNEKGFIAHSQVFFHFYSFSELLANSKHQPAELLKRVKVIINMPNANIVCEPSASLTTPVDTNLLHADLFFG